MRFWIPTLLLLPLASFAAGSDKRCVVSFDSASLDVCSLELKPVHEQLRALGALDIDTGGYRIVKFDGPIRASQRRLLESAGAKILGYAPHHAYLVQMDAAVEARARTLPGVIWAGPYLPIWKLDINLANDLVARRKSGGGKAGSIIEQAGIRELSIALQPGVELARARDGVLGVPGIDYRLTEKGFDSDRIVVGFEQDRLMEAVQALALNPEVASISLRWPNELMNSQAGWLHQSGQQTPVAGSMPAFENGIFGCGQVVAAADSGLHATHCSFADAEYGQPVTSVCSTGASCAPVTPDFDHRKIGAHYKWDGSTSGAPADGHGHGTHVMGSITGNNPATGAVDCATHSSPGGLTDLDGTAPGAKLISQEMGASLQYLNSGGGTIYHAATIAYGNGARVHNNSWGSSCRNSLGACISGCQVEYRSTSRDADAVVWDNPDLAVLVAAGNSGGMGGSAGCGPGADVGAAGNAKNVFSIGSNLRGASGNGMSTFSSRGPTSDRRLKPDLTAQGNTIVSASRTACGTATMSGTSMATPTASGLSALVREYLQRGFYPTGFENPDHAIATPSSALVKAILVSGAFEMSGSGTTGGAPSQSQGWGRILLGDSLYFDGDARSLWLHDEAAGLQTGGEFIHQLAVDAGEPLNITLVWHDAPALVNANPHGVNQLRLEVTAPNGDVWTQKLSAGGGLTDPNPFADTTTANYDDRNNVHRIEFPTPQAGAYTVRVAGIQVAEGPQPFALAATGKLLGLTEPDFVLQAASAESGICAGDPISITVGAFSFEGFNDPVTLAHGSLPGGASGAFSVNPLVPAAPAAQSVLSITGTAGLAAGPLSIAINAQADGPGFPASSKSRSLTLQVDAEAPVAVSLAAPADAATDLPLRPALSWDPIPGATGYRVELARDAAFADVVLDQVVSGTSLTPPTALLADSDYFWRVSASNRCGDGEVSAVRSFTTANLICSEPGVAIPDNNATGVTDTFSVANTGTLSGLRLQLDIDHTYIGDLRIWLVKGATEVQLLDRPGPNSCSGDNIKVIVDDGASLSLQTNCSTGTAYIEGESYRGMNPLAPFVGGSLDGQWSLRVSDHANIDTGRINRWCLLPVLGAPPVGLFANGFED